MSSSETENSQATMLGSNAMTPAPTVQENPLDKLESDGSSQKRHEEACQKLEGAIEDVTGTHDHVSLPLEDQLRKLMAKLQELELQREKDRIQQERLEEEVRKSRSDFGRFLPFPVNGEDDLDRQYRRDETRRARHHPRDQVFDEIDNGRVARHRRDMMLMYQRELSYLESEEKMVVGLMDERERLKGNLYALPGSPIRIGTTSEAGTGSEVVVVEERQKTPPPPDSAISELNFVEWTEFVVCRTIVKNECFAIDVLIGEPVLSWNYRTPLPQSRSTFRHRTQGFPMHVENAVERKPPVNSNLKKQQPVIIGQGPVPERIRIHSKLILTSLNEIIDTGLDNRRWTPIVMTRPFKSLVYYHDQIRQRIHELEIKSVPDHAGFEETVGGNNTVPNSIDNSDEQHKVGPGPKEREETVKLQNREDEEEENQAEEDDNGGRKNYTYVQKDIDTIASGITLQHLRCLDEFIKGSIQIKMDYLASDSCKMVSFHDLWFLFSPGEEVVGQHRRQAYRVMSVTSTGHKVIPPYKTTWDRESAKAEETPIILKCVYIDFDGKMLGPVSRTIEIPRYDGEKAVTALEVYPLRFAEEHKGQDKEAFRKSLIGRGKKFLDVARVKHMHYNGFSLETKEEVDSQVVIDFEEAFSPQNVDDRCSDWTPRLEVLIESKSKVAEGSDVGYFEDSFGTCEFACCLNELVYLDDDVDKKRNEEYIGSLVPEDRKKEPSVAIYPRRLDKKSPEVGITEDELVIMSYRVFGFVLRSRKWAKLDLTYLQPIGYNGKRETNELSEVQQDGTGEEYEKHLEATEKKEKQKTAFDHLVLPPGHKEMVVSLISQHFRDKEFANPDEYQNDIVRGKGKGLIILLHGLPGVGKTTTAEGVAELFKKPLFQITCGDLGTTAAEVEAALEKHFALASRWGCILLLDEADVFLAARTPQDFIRNGLVAVFLRVLEYYTGILFLTTNRIGDFDEAFASRIHISLHYPELSLDSTKKIFQLNLELIRERRKIDIREKEILDFAEKYWRANKKMRWNGRQIRNACQTALALAEFDAQGGSHERVKYANAEVQLKVGHLEIVSKAYLDFIMYLKKIYGQTGERRAKAMGLRAREGAVKTHEDEEEEDDDEEYSPMLSKHSTKATTAHLVGSAMPMPHPEPVAQPPAGYPYGPPPNWQGYPQGYGYPPHGYGPPAGGGGWPPQQGGGGGYRSGPKDGTGGHM